jgi:hypothetical protein
MSGGCVYRNGKIHVITEPQGSKKGIHKRGVMESLLEPKQGEDGAYVEQKDH